MLWLDMIQIHLSNTMLEFEKIYEVKWLQISVYLFMIRTYTRSNVL